MKGTWLLLLFFYYGIIGFNCAEIFVPRFTAADTVDKESSEDKLIHAVAAHTNAGSSSTGGSNTDETGFGPSFLASTSSFLQRWISNLMTSHWHKGDHVCKTENFTVQELNDTHSHMERFISVRRCFETDGKYACEITKNNGTHRTHTFEEYVCCPGYHLDDEGLHCKAVTVQKLSDVLTANKADKFEKHLVPEELDGHTIFAFPDDDSPLDDETVNNHIATELVHLTKAIDGKRVLTKKNTTIVLTSHHEDGKYVYRANCEKLISTNNYVSNDTIVHVAEKKLPTASLSTMEYINSNPDLSMARDIIDFALVSSIDAELLDLTGEPLYTAFIPKNKAVRKFLESWPSIGKKKELLRSMIANYIIANAAICACADKSGLYPIKAVETNGKEEEFKFREALIDQANIVTANGIVHILEDIGELPMELQPLEMVLKDSKKAEFLKAYSKLKEEWKGDDENYELTVFLPSEEEAVEQPFSDEEIRRHVFRTSNENILEDENSLYTKANVYGHIHNPGGFQRLSMNCVPVSIFSPMKFGEGYIFGVDRRIPEGFPNISEALKSTKQHELFSKLLEQYFKKHNHSEMTILAVEDSVLVNSSDSIPKSVSGFLGTGEISEEDSKDLEEFVGGFILDQELCYDGLAHLGFLHTVSGKSYKVKKTENGTLIGGAKVVASDMVTSNGIVHGLSALPKAHNASLLSTNLGGWSFFDIIFA